MGSQPLKWALALHGGAGVISGDEVAMDRAKAGLRSALLAGEGARTCAGTEILSSGGSALDAVEAVVASLEDNPCFNAGKGAVFTRNGHHELEASIMGSEGASRCGSCALVRSVKNPVRLARLVMEQTPHAMLSGPVAEALAEANGLDPVDPSYFFTELRHKQWLDKMETRQDSETVGAVAVDCNGLLAAATSTGGMTGKWDGRIGDTPIIGAGNYACPEVAVSGTGIGEQFMRHVVAHDVAARLMYKPGCSLQQAVQEVVLGVLQPGDGGVVAVDRNCNIAMEFNSAGMYRAAADHAGRFGVAIF